MWAVTKVCTMLPTKPHIFPCDNKQVKIRQIELLVSEHQLGNLYIHGFWGNVDNRQFIKM